MKAVIIQTTTSSKEEAKNIAEILIKYKLAACIQLKVNYVVKEKHF